MRRIWIKNRRISGVLRTFQKEGNGSVTRKKRGLRRFADDLQEADLRRFERALLQELGYGLTLTHDAQGVVIDPDAHYAYEIERGPVRLARPGNSALSVRGKTLLDLADDALSDPATQAEAKQMMRALINHHTGGKRLETRKIFMELQEL